MRDSTSSGTGTDSSIPVSQRAIKIIGNVFFSVFVFAVLILTVVAITYQPPDPWLQSSISLTKALSQTLPNSTFQNDDSLLKTGEDLTTTLAPSSSPTNEQQQSSQSPPSSSSSSSACSDTAALNCSDPAVLSAIQRFNSKVFRKSLVFLAYDTPVPGAHPDHECDASWRFRNRRDKSWRRYRDYRRFRLARADNCTYTVVSAGKFRSGANAAPPAARRLPRSAATAAAAVQPAAVPDAEINDTIPAVGSESDFRKGRYLYYTRGGDHCKGMNQFVWSFLCGLGEAAFLNRTFVMDLNLCLNGAHTSSGRDEEGKDFRYYFDFEHLKESASVVEEGEFLRDWHRWDRRSGGGRKARISVRKVPTYKVTPMQLRRDRSSIVWRQFDGPEPENYWYRVCEGRAAKYIQRPWQALWKSKRLMNIVTQIAGGMDWDYDAVHVVRGWKASNKDLWPNLDADTTPDALLAKVLKMVKPWRNLYIATNEPFYNYFDKLRSHYKVHLLDDYSEMWGNKSEWYNETMALNGGKPVEFDGYMRVAVDTEVLYRAKTQIETFNNLTRDCKDGINTC
ncbi:uncharacterized protein M6B38_255435 [Iris pallida]|uniref:O-fucosyltransferase family protein n=1 Tax=Iris pallida TaxID=29817 RepID=A0AAX6IGK2_IRIPA|nr:uncharacterized protein M6B38_255435 [Iris pallida]